MALCSSKVFMCALVNTASNPFCGNGALGPNVPRWDAFAICQGTCRLRPRQSTSCPNPGAAGGRSDEEDGVQNKGLYVWLNTNRPFGVYWQSTHEVHFQLTYCTFDS